MSENTKQVWAIIINPKSGKSKYRKQRKYLFGELKHAGIHFDYRVTKFAGHAIKIAKLFAERGYKKFLVLGGDGTMSEVINGIFSAETERTDDIRIAIIPRGTGNDWARFWGLTRDYKHATDIFLQAKSRFIDIGQVDYTLEGESTTHYFINSLGLGLDAKVVDLTHKLKRFTGSFSFLYTIALLGAVFTYRSRHLTLISDGKKQIENMFTMSIANGCYSGGGLKQAPNALPYDGLFDIMLARKPSFRDILSGLRYLFKGRLLEHPIITSLQANTLELHSNSDILMEADGILVYGTPPYRVKIIPNAIQMIVP